MISFDPEPNPRLTELTRTADLRLERLTVVEDLLTVVELSCSDTMLDMVGISHRRVSYNHITGEIRHRVTLIAPPNVHAECFTCHENQPDLSYSVVMLLDETNTPVMVVDSHLATWVVVFPNEQLALEPLYATLDYQDKVNAMLPRGPFGSGVVVQVMNPDYDITSDSPEVAPVLQFVFVDGAWIWVDDCDPDPFENAGC